MTSPTINGQPLSLGINNLCRAETVLGPLNNLLTKKKVDFRTIRVLIWAGLPAAANVELEDVLDFVGDTPPGELGDLVAEAITSGVKRQIDPETAANLATVKEGLGLEARIGGRAFRFTLKACANIEDRLGPIDDLGNDPERSASFTAVRCLIANGAVETMSLEEAGTFIEKISFPAAHVFVWALLRATFPTSESGEGEDAGKKDAA